MTTPAPDPHTPDGARRWFAQPNIQVSPPPAPGCFEIGLTLGGTVSAGAWTAGVLDFLIEALEQWEQARQQALQAGTALPPWQRHKVVLKVIAGTSGGGVCAATLAKALAYDFVHVRYTSDAPPSPATAAANPLFRLWTQTLDIEGFCAGKDLQDGPNAGTLRSLLNPGPLLQGCADIADFPTGPLAPASARPYVSEPLTLLLTLSNLTGVPYKVAYSAGSNRGQNYRKHADYVRIECHYTRASLQQSGWPDALQVTSLPNPPDHFTPWQDVTHFARATGAFPVGFPPVSLSRPAWHYLYQPVITHRLQGTYPKIVQIPEVCVWEPAWANWNQNPQAAYHFTAVDGGVFNNEPVELARRHLAGLLGSNPRSGEAANRAIILIDPFSDEVSPGVSGDPSLFQTVGGLAGACLSNARYSSQDFHLAGDDNVYSRFLLTAIRSPAGEPSISGSGALACSPLSAFGGFLSPAFREHDFYLGRRNCQRFLQAWFTLPANNPLFGVTDTKGALEYPIIPLLGSAVPEQGQAPWPAKAFALDTPRPGDAVPVEDMVKARLGQVVGTAINALPFWPSLLARLLKGFICCTLGKSILSTITQALRQAGLAKAWWR